MHSGGAGIEAVGRWFRYGGGYPYLVGYDYQELFCKKAYTYADVERKLDAFVKYRINKVRVWANCWFMRENAYYPWAVDENGKKNLDAWDDVYWTRMKDFVQMCKDRDIVVEFTIFSPYPNNTDFPFWTNCKYAFNKEFNVNNAFTANESGNFYPQFFNLDLSEKSSSGKRLYDYQKALCDKSIDELNGYGNVFFEVFNEFPTVDALGEAVESNYKWQLHWAEYMHSKGAITGVHANEFHYMNKYGITHYRDKSYIDVLTFHVYAQNEDSPDDISSFLHDLQPYASKHRKILQNNESHAYNNTALTDMCTREAWSFFVSGGYYFHYSEDTDDIGTPEWNGRAERLMIVRNVAESVNFRDMSPIDEKGGEYDSLVSAGPGACWQVLAKPGSEYVVYFCGEKSSDDADINLPAGSYSYIYYDTRVWDSSGLSSGTVNTAGGRTVLGAPPAGGWCSTTGLTLVLKKL